MSNPLNCLTRYVPHTLRVEVERRPNLKKIVVNIGWLFIDKGVRLIISIFVGVWVARYLGPEQFGLFNYVMALIGFFAALGTLGLNNIVVRDLVLGGESVINATLGTAFFLQLIGGILAYGLAIATIALLRPHDAIAATMVIVAGAILIIKATDVIRCWFEAKVQSKYIVLAETSVMLIFAVAKVILICSDASLMAFVWIALAEAGAVGIMMFVMYEHKGRKLIAWRYQYDFAKSLLNASWPLMLSGLAAMIYMRLDQIMLGEMVNDQAVGIFSAAVRLSEVWYFIPLAIVGSVYPAILVSRKTSLEIYHQRLIALFELMTVIALAAALPLTFLSEWIIELLYGPGYAEAADILVIHIWTGVFVFLGVASSRWFIAEDLQRFTFYRTAAGCLVNVILNFLLIPGHGPIGAALASLISQAVACVMFNALNLKTRPLFFMQINVLSGISLFKKLYVKR